MGMTATPRTILTGRVTNIVLRSDRGNWTIGNPGKPVFTVAGASGDSISEQCVLDPYTAVVSMKSAQANATLSLTDTKNNDATSVSVLGATQIAAIGQAVVDDTSKVIADKSSVPLTVTTGHH